MEKNHKEVFITPPMKSFHLTFSQHFQQHINMMKYFLISLIALLCACSAEKTDNQQTSNTIDSEEEDIHCCPVNQIYIISDGTVSKTLLNQLRDSLDDGRCWEYTNRLYYNRDDYAPAVVSDEIIDLKPYTTSSSRIRADKVIDADTCNMEGLIIVTAKDICAPVRGKKEWGILGLSKKTHSCIISTYRLKNKKDLWKLAIHELNHSYGIPHCTSNDPHCIMKDANKHPHFETLTHVCDGCKAKQEDLHGDAYDKRRHLFIK